MTIEQIKSMLQNSPRNKVKYRDEYNFIVWGICLNKEVQTENNESFIFVDSLTNKVSVNKIIEIRAL